MVGAVRRPSTSEAGSVAWYVYFGALALGIAIRAVDFLNCRSLSLDESRLAINIAARSYFGLLTPLDLDQTAPPLFLWGERLLVQVFGHGDCILRLLPVVAGTAAAILMYPFARRYLEPAEARLAAMIGIFCPLLITYSNAVKQYSVELLVAMGLLIVAERALAKDGQGRWAALLLASGMVAPWLSLTSAFVLATCWAALAARALRQGRSAARPALAATVCWGVSGAAAYWSVYVAASRNRYMHRFWELAFIDPARPGFAGRLWKTVEDLVWGFVAGDPLVDRRPFLTALHVGTALVAVLLVLGTLRVLRGRGAGYVWWLWGPVLATLAASMLGLFPVAPRLTLFVLPGVVVLFVAGLSEVVARVAGGSARRGFAVASAAIVLPMEFQAVVRTFALEPSGHFQQLVREVRERRRPGEPVYVFARSLPAWIYYSTDWAAPDTARLHFLVRAAAAGGPAFENTPSRGRVTEVSAAGLTFVEDSSVELLGLPSGMEWREVEEHVRLQPDSGWVETESRRIEQAAAPGIWVLASTYYEPESRLFEVLEREASRRTFAHLRNGSALVRYEFSRDSSRIGSSSGPRMRSAAAAPAQ